MELEVGRPNGNEKRLDKEIMVYDLLDKLKIDFFRIDHKAMETMEQCKEVDKVLGEVILCKNLFLCNSQKTMFYMLMLPGDKKFITKEVSKQINSSRLSFAGEDYLNKFLGLTSGSVSITGLMNDKDNKVKLLIDEDVIKQEYMACHPNINTSSIKLKTKDVLDKFLKAINHEPIFVKLEGDQ